MIVSQSYERNNVKQKMNVNSCVVWNGVWVFGMAIHKRIITNKFLNIRFARCVVINDCNQVQLDRREEKLKGRLTTKWMVCQAQFGAESAQLHSWTLPASQKTMASDEKKKNISHTQDIWVHSERMCDSTSVDTECSPSFCCFSLSLSFYIIWRWLFIWFICRFIGYIKSTFNTNWAQPFRPTFI